MISTLAYILTPVGELNPSMDLARLWTCQGSWLQDLNYLLRRVISLDNFPIVHVGKSKTILCLLESDRFQDVDPLEIELLVE